MGRYGTLTGSIESMRRTNGDQDTRTQAGGGNWPCYLQGVMESGVIAICGAWDLWGSPIPDLLQPSSL